MYLTETQKAAIHLLRTFRCLRADQLARLLVSQDTFADRQVRRLPLICSHLIVKPQEGYWAVPNAVPDRDMIMAVDVMLEFDGIEFCEPGKAPFTLTFIKKDAQGRLRAYYVAAVPIGAEDRVALQARMAYRGKNNAVVFILDDLQQADVIRFPHEHYHAIQGQGGIAFYKGVVTED
jgi:hypothetical protein